jgi:hypothetical protein
VLLTLLFGPVGLIYVSVTGGLVCTALTTLALALLGFQPLLVAWPITVLCAWILASGTQREFQDRTIR